MSFLNGKNGSILVGASTADQNVIHIQNWNIDHTADTIEGWGMGDSDSITDTTIRKWSGSFVVYIDPTDTNAALFVPGTKLQGRFFPGENTTGNEHYDGAFVITGVNREAAKDGIPGQTISLASRGALTRTTVA